MHIGTSALAALQCLLAGSLPPFPTGVALVWSGDCLAIPTRGVQLCGVGLRREGVER